jgi:predicted MFS family arabinose efflux permease
MILKAGVVRAATQSDEGDAQIFGQTNVAIWVLTAAAGAFLGVRLWCRYRFSKLWWDDGVLTLSWVRLPCVGEKTLVEC